ncbi:MAG TPA: calcium/sodium antiporter [Ignavibacteriaceae bacterium]|nr:calcium/sodium antiporter [Ignavibacteriaceae bacterium]
MTVVEIIIYISAGLLMLFTGAEGLIRGSSSLALRVGITPLVVGLIVVAFGTSSPELVVSLKAAIEGNGDISLGNVIGSNIANIALVLGVAALIRPLKVNAVVIRREIPIMIFISLIFVIFLINREISRIEGIIFFAGIIIYSIVSVLLARKEKSKEIEDEYSEGVAKKPLKIWQAIPFIIIGLAFLIYGANLFLEGSLEIAKRIGMSQAVIGLTIVAIGTSLPELVTSAVASIKKETDIAIGNVVGSNVFNILLILGVTAMIIPISAAEITMTDIVVMMFTAVIILPMTWTKFELNRLEGALLLTGYIIYIYYLLP